MFFFQIEEKLKQRATFIKTTHQIDEYFTPAHRNFLGCPSPFEWLSLRKRGDKVTLNYKYFYPPNAEIHTHCDEFETEIEEQLQLEKILYSLDFKKLITVEKERKTYLSNDGFQVCLDQVRDLGYFVEVEATKIYETVEKTRVKLIDFSQNLGIDVSKTDEVGYAALLLNPKNYDTSGRVID